MSSSTPPNTWLSIPGTWKPNTIADSVCRKFLFYHIRPAGWKVELSATSGPHANQTFIVQPGQVSLVIDILPGFFRCVTLTGSTLDSQSDRLSMTEYANYHRRGKAKLWHLSANNLFLGPYEVFNGPNPIDLTVK